MTRYTVTWWKAAGDELAEIWLAGPDRTAVSQASHVIDQELREHAGIWIERSAEEPYFINVGMLRAYFRVTEMDRLVEIFKVVRVNQAPE